MEGLTRGQPIKYRYAGPTEKGAAASKEMNSVLTASEYVIQTLQNEPLSIIPQVMSSSVETRDFMRAILGHFSANYHTQFNSWYRNLNRGERNVISALGVKVKEPATGVNQEYAVSGEYAFNTLPSDFPLPKNIQDKIEKNNRNIDEAKGAKEFTYGVINTANNGYKEAKNFQLGDFFSWATLGGIVLTDPHYKYEVVPVTKGELLTALCAEIMLYEPRIRQGGLDGAIEARKQYLLQGIYIQISQLDGSSNNGVIEIVESDNLSSAPETGVYVVKLRDGLRKTNFKPFAVKVNPRREESLVAKVLETMDMKRETAGRLEAFEVPREALKYVTNPKTLELKLS